MRRKCRPVSELRAKWGLGRISRFLRNLVPVADFAHRGAYSSGFAPHPICRDTPRARAPNARKPQTCSTLRQGIGRTREPLPRLRIERGTLCRAARIGKAVPAEEWRCGPLPSGSAPLVAVVEKANLPHDNRAAWFRCLPGQRVARSGFAIIRRVSDDGGALRECYRRRLSTAARVDASRWASDSPGKERMMGLINQPRPRSTSRVSEMV